MQKSKITVRWLVLVGLMAALCLIGNYFSIPIPIGIDRSRIHAGTILCILSSFMLGPLGGGLAAGIGGFLFDIFTGYGWECIITFANKFAMSFVCGWILVAGRRRAIDAGLGRRILASVAGTFTYVALYMAKSAVQLSLLSNTGGEADAGVTILATVLGKGGISLLNGMIAVVLANVLFTAIRPAIRGSLRDE